MLPDYPELPKEDPTAFNDSTGFSATPSGYPTTTSVGTDTLVNTTHQPTNLVSPDTADRYLVQNGVTINTQSDSLLTDRIVPQVSAFPAHGPGPVSTDYVVPNVNIGSLAYSGIPNGLPTGYSVHQPTPETYPVQHPIDNHYAIPAVAPYSVQEVPALPQDNIIVSSHPQMNVVEPGPHPQQDVALPGSYMQPQHFVTPETHPQDTGISHQQSMHVPVVHQQQDDWPHLSSQNMAFAQGPYRQQDMPTPGTYLQHNMATPALHPHQEMSPAHGNMVEPVPQLQHSLQPALMPPQYQMPPQQQMAPQHQMPPQQQMAPQHQMPPQQQMAPQHQMPPQQQQNASQTIPQNISPQNQPPFAGGGWSHNPRVAYGPIPAPPTYEDAHMMPSHPPVQPPLPPPISVPPPSSISSPNSTAPATLHTDPMHTVVGPDHLNWSGSHHEPNTPYLDNARNSQPMEPISHAAPVVQVARRPADAPHPQIVQPVGVQMVPPRHHNLQQVVGNKTNHVVHHQPDLTHALSQLHAERDAALEREKQERALLEKEKEQLRRRREELETMISKSSATEQQVMEWKQQLVAKENELSAKEMEQKTALQERQKLQEQKEKEISDIAQKLNEEREALEKQKEQQQTELIRQQESIEQQKTAAMIELQRQRDAILQQQKELSVRQQNMEEQVSKWLQMRGENNNRQLHIQTGLPAGWEKKFDSTTGRFYYQDHNTKTTHWNPPSNWLSYNNNNTQLKQGVSNNLVQPPQRPVSTSNSLPQPSSRSTEGKNLPASTTTGPLHPPLSVTMKKPSQVPTAGHNPSTGPPVKMLPDSNRAAVVPDRSTKPQQRDPSTQVKPIPPHVWKQKMDNLQAVHGGSMVSRILLLLIK